MVVTISCFLGVSLGALYMSVSTFRHGGAYEDGPVSRVEFRGRGCRASLAALVYASMGLGGLFVSALMTRDAAGCRVSSPEHEPIAVEPQLDTTGTTGE